MKYAFMSFSTPQLSLPETLSLAARIGYAGIEPRTGRDHAHHVELERTPRERREIRQSVEDAGVEICCLALGTKFADPVTSAAAIEEGLRYIGLAAEIGCRRLRVFGGEFSVSREKAIDTMVESLAQLAPAAQAADVTFCVETHDAWTLPEHVAEVMRRVNHSHIAVNWDIMHPFRTSRKSMPEAFLTLSPWIRHVHTHDGTLADPLILQPTGEGDIDIRAALLALLKDGYDGFISGEWIGAPIDIAEEFRRLCDMERTLESEFASPAGA